MRTPGLERFQTTAWFQKIALKRRVSEKSLAITINVRSNITPVAHPQTYKFQGKSFLNCMLEGWYVQLLFDIHHDENE
jgi:hypothetical protein